MSSAQPLTIAVPKGRILQELQPLLARAQIFPEESFFDEHSRALKFATKDPMISLIRVRSFDVATFVAFGGAQLGVCGSDVLMEHDYADLYMPVDLNIGHCRLSLAQPKGYAAKSESHVRVATKYPNITQDYFAQKGIQAECIKLSGAMELAPSIGLAPYIVDLVSSGKTLIANGLEEVAVITQISSRLIINRAAFKTRNQEIAGLIERFREAVNAA